jgi:uncharacterized protein YqeY
MQFVNICPLKKAVSDDMKQYMKAKDTYALEAVRMLMADIKNAEIDSQKEMVDDDVVQAVKSALRKHKESLEMYSQGDRPELVEKTQRYIDTLTKYLPAQLSDAELEALVRSAIAELGDINPKTDFGKAMKAAMTKVGNKADGKLISEKVKQVLG